MGGNHASITPAYPTQHNTYPIFSFPRRIVGFPLGRRTSTENLSSVESLEGAKPHPKHLPEPDLHAPLPTPNQPLAVRVAVTPRAGHLHLQFVTTRLATQGKESPKSSQTSGDDSRLQFPYLAALPYPDPFYTSFINSQLLPLLFFRPSCPPLSSPLPFSDLFSRLRCAVSLLVHPPSALSELPSVPSKPSLPSPSAQWLPTRRSRSRTLSSSSTAMR